MNEREPGAEGRDDILHDIEVATAVVTDEEHEDDEPHPALPE
jgi:hypothetical protein